MKVQEVYSMAYETFEDVVENLPRLLEEVNHNKRGLRLRARLSQSTTVRERSFWAAGQISDMIRSGHWDYSSATLFRGI